MVKATTREQSQSPPPAVKNVFVCQTQPPLATSKEFWFWGSKINIFLPANSKSPTCILRVQENKSPKQKKKNNNNSNNDKWCDFPNATMCQLLTQSRSLVRTLITSLAKLYVTLQITEEIMEAGIKITQWILWKVTEESPLASNGSRGGVVTF